MKNNSSNIAMIGGTVGGTVGGTYGGYTSNGQRNQLKTRLTK